MDEVLLRKKEHYTEFKRRPVNLRGSPLGVSPVPTGHMECARHMPRVGLWVVFGALEHKMLNALHSKPVHPKCSEITSIMLSPRDGYSSPPAVR